MHAEILSSVHQQASTTCSVEAPTGIERKLLEIDSKFQVPSVGARMPSSEGRACQKALCQDLENTDKLIKVSLNQAMLIAETPVEGIGSVS